MRRGSPRDLWGQRVPFGSMRRLGETAEDGMLEVPASGGTSTKFNLQANLPSIVEAAVTALEAAQDPARRVEVLRVRAAQARARGDEAQAQVLEARMRGWQRQLALDNEAVQSRREWRGLGKALLISGIALLVVLSAGVLRWARGRQRHAR